ncbi:rRNA maturation RNase YbeY [Texcoconibacillus texcoconensis]|uniref:Endoribonuclease YbeY n=1 Tax=Texcoconibacillus texcoconensis TaxID=1095777 RepID=A0A840QR48_9BACI|nr:rRNA maturation RNase YbeY [Texcoconibacillus texcoconensis]MBB5173936.1 putative rRNA maturation factor [Texcoconibacillus texcoconensis]
MTLQIDLLDENGYLTDEQKDLVQQLLKTAGKVEEVAEDSEVSVSFVDDETIHSLNNEYREKDKPTDVLSFALNEGEEETVIGADHVPELLGDIVISVPRAHEQAKEYGHTFSRELGFLAVHGFLHLLGYDHDTDENKREMFAKQETILNEHGLQK